MTDTTQTVSISVSATSLGAATLRAVADTIDNRPGASAAGKPTAAVAAAVVPTKKRGRPSKAELAARDTEEPEADEFEPDDEPVDDEGEADTDDEADTEDAADDEIAEDDEPKLSKKKLDMDKDVIPAFQAYAKKHTREKAGKLLKTRFKCNSVRDIPPARFAEAVKLLKGG